MVDDDVAPGALLGGYRVEELVARRPTAVLYRARDERLGREVALEVIPAEVAGQVGFGEALAAELRVLIRVDHPNLLPVYEVREQDGSLVVAARATRSEPLRALIEREGALPARRAASIVAQCASALAAVRAGGVQRGELTLAGFIVTPEDHVYLTPLSASGASANGPALSDTWVGGLDLLSPEQVRGETIDERSDVYALTCLLFELLTGAPPWGDRPAGGRLRGHLDEPPPPVRTVAPSVPAELETLCLRGMAKDPADRPQRLDAFAAEVLDAAQAAPTAPTPAYTPAGGAGAAASAATTGPLPVAEPAPEPEPRLLGPVALVLGALALLALLAVPALLVRAIDRNGGATTTSARVAPQVTDVAGLGARVWVTSAARDRLVPVDPRTGRARGAAIPTGDGPLRVAAAPGALWTANTGDGTVTRRDPRGRGAGVTTVLGADAVDLTASPDATYVTTGPAGTVLRLDPLTGQVLGDPIRVGRYPTAIAHDGHHVWVVDAGGPAVVRLDPKEDLVAGRPLPVGRDPQDVVSGFGSIWVANRGDGTVTRLDAGTGRRQATVRTGGEPTAMAVGANAVLVVDPAAARLVRIDPASGDVSTAAELEGSPGAIAIAAGSAWVTDARSGRVTRVSG
jgi:serine/threonine-protein kinase